MIVLHIPFSSSPPIRALSLCFFPRDLSLFFSLICLFMYKTRAGRAVADIDYQPLHSDGTRVYKNRGGNTAMEDLKTQSIKICSDIEDFDESYNLEDITEDYELEQYVSELKILKQEYRRIHKLLKSQ